jgi:hypothetical protein
MRLGRPAPGATPGLGAVRNRLGSDLEVAVCFQQIATAAELGAVVGAGGLLVANPTYTAGPKPSGSNFQGNQPGTAIGLVGGPDGPVLRLTSPMIGGVGFGPWVIWNPITEVGSVSQYTIALTVRAHALLAAGSPTRRIFVVGSTVVGFRSDIFTNFVEVAVEDGTGAGVWVVGSNTFTLGNGVFEDMNSLVVVQDGVDVTVYWNGADMGTKSIFGATVARSGAMGFGSFLQAPENAASCDVGCMLYARRLWAEGDVRLFHEDPYALWRPPQVYPRIVTGPHGSSVAGRSLEGKLSTRGATLDGARSTQGRALTPRSSTQGATLGPKLSVAGRSMEPRTSEATDEHH